MLATQMADLEAESLQKTVHDRWRINVLEADLKDKEEILQAMTELLQQLGGAAVSPSSIRTDLVAQLERATRRFQEVEEKLAETERSTRSKDADLAQAKADIQTLQNKLMVSDASHLKLEIANKQLEGLHKADQDEVYSVKVLDGSNVSFKLRAETCIQVPTRSVTASSREHGYYAFDKQ